MNPIMFDSEILGGVLLSEKVCDFISVLLKGIKKAQDEK